MAIYMCDIHPARVSAAKHFSYIMRDGAYKRNGGLMTDDENKPMIGNGNLPAWAVGSPKSFWKTDDKFENGNKYREAVIALPNELSANELITLVENIQKKICPHSAYAYAIHDSVGSLSGKKNTHVHLMFCEREIESDRPEPDKENYFKKSRTLKCGGISGGYRKGKNFGAKRKQWLKDARKSVESCINEALERNGIDERVSSKSLKDQKKEYAAKHTNVSQEELAAKFHLPSPKLGKNRIHLFKNHGIKSDRFLEYEDIKEYNSLSDEIFATRCKFNDAITEKKSLEKEKIELLKEYNNALLEEKQAEKKKEQELLKKSSLSKEHNGSLAEEKNTPSKVVSAVNSSLKCIDKKEPQRANKGTQSALAMTALKESTSDIEKEVQGEKIPQQNKIPKETPVVTSHLSAFSRPGHYKSVFVSVNGGKDKMYDEKNFDKLIERYPEIAKKYGITTDIVNIVKAKNKGKRR